jgi:sulfotransferase family protein
MSPVKEPRFFIELRPDRQYRGDNYIGDREEYERLFDSEAAVRGENTPSYSMYPFHEGVPARIQAAVPAAKIVYLVGDPVKRVVAQWMQGVAFGSQKRSLTDALEGLDRPEHPLVCPGRYATQVEQYLEFFPAERIKVVDQDALRADRRAALREIFSFLEVDPDYWSPEFEVVRNAATDHRQVRTGFAGRVRSSRLRRVTDPLPPRARTALIQATRRVVARKVERPALEPALEARLEEIYRPETERLRTLTGQAFAGWSV